MTDAIKALTNWLNTEPNATEVIIIRKRSNDFSVKLEYGDRTTVPCVDADLNEALLAAVDQADRLPSSRRKDAIQEKRPMRLPGM